MLDKLKVPLWQRIRINRIHNKRKSSWLFWKVVNQKYFNNFKFTPYRHQLFTDILKYYTRGE